MTRPYAAAVLPSPGHDQADAVAAVTAAIDAALDNPGAVIVRTGSCDDADTRAAFGETPTRARKVALATPGGRGAQILDALDWLGPGTGPVLIADTGTRSPEPAVYRALLDSVGNGSAMAVADHPRYWTEANFTNHLARPLLDVALGLDCPQPLALDLAVSPGTLTVLPTVLRAAAGSPAASVTGYGIGAVLLLAAARTGTVTPVQIGNPWHAAPLEPLARLHDIHHQTVPVLLALTTARRARPRKPGPAPVYRTATRPVGRDDLVGMVAVLNGLAPYEPGFEDYPWPLPLANAWHTVRTGSAGPAEAARVLWPHYVNRVRDWITTRPGDGELAATHTRLAATLTTLSRSLTE